MNRLKKYITRVILSPLSFGEGLGVRLLLLLSLSACGEQTLKVALLVGAADQQTTEQAALGRLLETEKGVSYTYVPLNRLDDLSAYDMVWYHRESPLGVITEQETAAGDAITRYVSEGGKLILSMEAVKLLNTWGIEPEVIQSTTFEAKDEGFGRKVGFHAYREHPLFDKLFGGAYTWHGKEDNACPALGFFGDDVKPRAKGAKVIGTLWEYIYYHPTDKVLWETPVGKGKILAIGGFLYYDRENFHTAILNQFTRNCLDYLADRPSGSKAFYWEDRPTEVVAEEMPTKRVDYPAASAWDIAVDKGAIQWQAGTASVDLPSKRGVLIAKERSGIEEVWTHPFMSLRDYRVWLDLAGSDTLVSLNSFDTWVELRPNALIRTYVGQGFQLREVLTTQIDRPVTVAHYEWSGPALRRVITDYKSNLRFMWPYDEYALGSLYHHWSAPMNAFIIRDVNQEFVSVVGANLPGKPLLAGRFDGFTYPGKLPEGIPTEKLQVASSVAYDVTGKQALDIYLAAGNEGVGQAFADYAEVTKAPQDVFRASAGYYQAYLDRHLTITTPDSLFNEGFRWATLSSAQFIAQTPGVGTSLMAGYSSSRRGWGGAHPVSGRPGYAWYFGRDAIWSALAFAGLGDFQTVREVLETLIRYQQVDGKIYHELTTSGSVHFDASDATPQFVSLMARYLRASGDLDFVRRHQTAVRRAMDYGYSTDTDGDRLIEISNVGHGWLEGGDLYGSHTEFYLVGLWNAALNDAAYLSGVMGDATAATAYRADAEAVNQIINRDFWNEKGYYNYGKWKDGTYTDECIVLTTVPVYLGVTDPERSLQMVKAFASGRYSADWGVRMIDDSHSIFNPTAYHFGSVWPLFTGWTALAEYQVGRYNQGFSHILSSLLNYRGTASHGRVPEVINGLIYQPSGVTTHQCWSETMVLQPTIEGLLGFVPDALNGQMTLAPRLPAHWDTFQAKNLRVGSASLTFDMKRGGGVTRYTFSSDSGLAVSFNPSFPLGTKVDRVLVNGKAVSFQLLDDAEYVTFSLPVAVSGTTVVEVSCHGGMSALPTYALLEAGQPSKSIHVLGQKYTDGVLEVTVEGRPGTQSTLELYLPDGYQRIDGAQVVSGKKGVVKALVTFDVGTGNYVTSMVKVSGP